MRIHNRTRRRPPKGFGHKPGPRRKHDAESTAAMRAYCEGVWVRWQRAEACQFNDEKGGPRRLFDSE